MKIIYKTSIPDHEQYFPLFESTGWNDEYNLTKEELYSSLEKSYFFVSAFDSDKMIGFGRVVSDGVLHAMIYEMIVYPEYQGKGIGTKILNMLIKNVRMTG